MALDPATGELAAQAYLATTQAITQGGPRRQYKWNKRAAEDTNRMNRENAEWNLQQNERLQREQREYDSPQSQMARYRAAGLNPNLIYGGGSGSSGGTFAITAPGIAPTRVDAPDASYPDVARSFLEAGQTLAQTNLTEYKLHSEAAKAAVAKAQEELIRSNPMLDPHVRQSVVFEMEATANRKAQEERYIADFAPGEKKTRAEMRYDLGQNKVESDITGILADLGVTNKKGELLEIDKKIKNEILQSKQFENALKKIQVDWMKDGDITWQHIYQGLLLLISKMM